MILHCGWTVDHPPERRLTVEKQQPAVGDFLRRQRVWLGLLGSSRQGKECNDHGREQAAHGAGLRKIIFVAAGNGSILATSSANASLRATCTMLQMVSGLCERPV